MAFNFPVLSSLAGLFSGTVTDEFKKLIQPQSLVAAAVFLALNLTLILPELVRRRVPFATTLAGLSTAWDVLLATLVLFILGYLVNCLGNFFLNILSGTTLRDSPLVGQTLISWQQNKFQQLQDTTADNTKSDSERSAAAYRLATEFPRDKEGVAPTRLGNVLLNAASYTLHQYGAHLDTVWPVLNLALKDKDASLHGRIREQQESLLFFASLTVLLLVVAGERLLLLPWLLTPAEPGTYVTRGFPWLAPALLVAAAYGVYGAALQKAHVWNNDIRLAFDLYLASADDMLKLHQLPVQAFETRRERWRHVSEWLIYGASAIKGYPNIPEQQELWYVAPATQPEQPEVQHPEAVHVQRRSWLHTRSTNVPSTQARWVREIAYLFSIEHRETGEHARSALGTYLVVTDTRLKSIPDEVTGYLTGGTHRANGEEVTGIRQPGDPDMLLWSLGNLPPQSNRVLRYTIIDKIPLLTVEVSSPHQITTMSAEQHEHALMLIVTIHNSGQQAEPLTIEATPSARFDQQIPAHYARVRADGARDPTRPLSATPQGDTIRWTIPGDIPAQAGVEVLLPLSDA